MDIRPILSTLRRHKTAASLIVLEIMLTCAILCNAMDLIAQRVQRMQRSTGWAESELLVVSVVGIGARTNGDAVTRQDLAVLRQLPGVRSATVTNQVPYGNSSWNTSVQLTPDQQRRTLSASQYMASEHFLDTTGVRLIAGRDFTPDEYLNDSSDEDVSGRALSVIVNRGMAERLFPGGEALGKTVYQSKQPLRIVGIVEPMSAVREFAADKPVVVLPLRLASNRGGNYLIRVTDPAQRQQVLQAAVAALQQLDNNRVILRQLTFEEIKDKFFASDRAMCWLMVGVCAALLVVTALGIVGLASFWVQQRTRMIGTRRALGATRGQILRYFQTENLLLTTLGIGLGMAAAFALNRLLMTQYELPRLPLTYLPVGAVALWLLGQVAVLGPALRAAALPPVVVMRAS